MLQAPFHATFPGSVLLFLFLYLRTSRLSRGRKNVACLLFLNSSVAYFLLSQSFSHLLVLVNSHARFLALSSFAGYVYYYNSRTGISQWERPMELDFPLSK